MLLLGNTVAGGWMNNSLLNMAVVFAVIYAFIKYCGWAKKFSLSRGVKKAVFLLTIIAVGYLNYQYFNANEIITATGNWTWATAVVLMSLLWVLVFAFALVAQTKEKF